MKLDSQVQISLLWLFDDFKTRHVDVGHSDQLVKIAKVIALAIETTAKHLYVFTCPVIVSSFLGGPNYSETHHQRLQGVPDEGQAAPARLN